MFKVKAKVVDIVGDQEKFPCMFLHKVGDEGIYDGESWTGKFCPDLWPEIVEKGTWLWHAGPRYTEPKSYSIFGIHGQKQLDPARRIYDGVGLKPFFGKYDIPKYHMASLAGERQWPPPKERPAKPIKVMCPDVRTLVVVQLEAIDVSGGGFAAPYYRRQMVIMDRVLKKQGIEEDRIISEFSKFEIDEIFPPLSTGGIHRLMEELILMGHMELKNGQAYVTGKGEKKVEEFKKSLTAAERKALKV